MGCGYLPTGYLPTGYLPIGADATGGGSLRGKSAAAATLSMATSPAVTTMMIFMMLIPLVFWAPGRADRVTPLFRFVCARRPLLPSHVPAQSPGGMAPDYLSPRRSNGSNVIGRIGTVVSGSDAGLLNQNGSKGAEIAASGQLR